MRAALTIVTLLLLGCQTVDPNSPEGAFKKIALCIDKADAACLYGSLDRDSRWSVQTIYKTLLKARQLVEKSYPAEARGDALGTWKEEAYARDPADVFAIYCKKRKCLEQVAKKFGAVTGSEKKGEDRIVLRTTRGGEFEMFYAEERWGTTIFEKELQEIKIRILDRASQVGKNAKEFEEQRAAGTIGNIESKGEGKLQ